MAESILAGRYQIVGELSRGGFGQTFLAQDSHLPGAPICVVKQLKPRWNDPSTFAIAKRFFDREAEILYQLGREHDQIPALLAHFEQNGEFYLVQELIEGQTLEQEMLTQRHLGVPQVLELLQDVLTVLAFVHHQNVIHRDIKPANLMRRHRDRKMVLIDFGAVKAVRTQPMDARQPHSFTVAIGSPGYMPSEQLAGTPHFSSDLYAVGMVCLQLLTGIVPIDLPKEPETGEYSCRFLDLSVPPDLAAILDRMVRYDYRQRYHHAAEALQALQKLQPTSMATTLLTWPDRSSPSPGAAMMRMPSEPMAAPLLVLDEPEGQVSLDSPFYIERPPIEADCYEAIVKSGALIRIKAPRQMGKSSLLSRILNNARQQGCQVAALNFQAADAELLTNLDRFLQWFAGSITEALNLTSTVDLESVLGHYWKGVLGSKNKCTNYFQRYLLAEVSSPLVLGLDEVDQIFQYPAIATDFFGLLRAWHEKAKNEVIWKRLRLIVVHSKEVYIPLNINQSPFNVGLPIELPELNLTQVQDLTQRHGLTLSAEELQPLMQLTGGHPYLVRVALYQIARGRITLAQLWEVAPTEAGLYGNHLRRHLFNLQEEAALASAFRQVVMVDYPVRLEINRAFKLRSMGLVKLQGNDVVPFCELYARYFRDRLAD